MVNWVYKAHNNANRILNKPIFTPEQFLNTYLIPLKRSREGESSISAGRILGGGLFFIACISIIGFSCSIILKKRESERVK